MTYEEKSEKVDEISNMLKDIKDLDTCTSKD